MQTQPSNFTLADIIAPLASTFLFTLALVVCAVAGDSFPWERIPYQICLFALCAGSFFLLRRNASLRLIAFFMPFYYALFGAAEFLGFFIPSKYVLYEASASIKKMGMSDAVILIGGFALVVGAFSTVSVISKAYSGWFSREWKSKPAYWIAVCCWIVGATALFVVQIIYESLGRKIGFLSHIISNASYLSLLGGIILIYLASAKGEKRYLFYVTLGCIIACEYIIGFIGNTKEISYRLPLLVVISGFFMRGNFNKKLVILIILSFVPYQALFTAYRDEIIQIRRMTTLQALEHSERTEAAVRKFLRREKEPFTKAFFIAVDRVDCRKYIDIITANVGTRVRYQEGNTLLYFFYSFVPRALWENKPLISVGQLFNHEFKLSESRLTFVPTTQVGELYWNFGLIAVLVGMFLIGAVLAFIGRSCSLGNYATVTRYLVLLVTAYVVGLRFEDGIAVTYSKLIRMLLMISVIDFIMRVTGATESAKAPEPAPIIGNSPREATTGARRTPTTTPSGVQK
jgi:hypothetical protein